MQRFCYKLNEAAITYSVNAKTDTLHKKHVTTLIKLKS